MSLKLTVIHQSDGQVYEFTVGNKDKTIADVKAELVAKTGKSPNRMRLVKSNSVANTLADNTTLRAANINDGEKLLLEDI